MTMKIVYDPSLVEQAVGRAVYGKAKLEARLHRQIDKLYILPAGRDRESLFRAAYADFFEELNLGSIFDRLLGERPIISERVARCLIREAPRSKAESGELLVQPGEQGDSPAGRTLVIQVTIESVVEPSRVEARLRRDFFHVADMLDEDFQYRREEIDGLPPQQNLLRDRYRVLWDIAIEGRLEREGRCDARSRARLEAMYRRVFGGRGLEQVQGLLDSGRPTHPELFSQASLKTAPTSQESGEGSDARPQPGAPCPLCGFPTHDWFDFERQPSAAAIDQIRRVRTEWTSGDGSCRQCAEIYQAMAASPA